VGEQVVDVEDRPVGVVDLVVGVGGYLREHVPMDEAFLPQRAREHGLDRRDESGGAVGDDQQRVAQPTLLEPVEELAPRIGALGAAGVEADEHRLAVAGDAPCGEHRLGARASVHLEH
jgi:hypothetical protein